MYVEEMGLRGGKRCELFVGIALISFVSSVPYRKEGFRDNLIFSSIWADMIVIFLLGEEGCGESQTRSGILAIMINDEWYLWTLMI